MSDTKPDLSGRILAVCIPTYDGKVAADIVGICMQLQRVLSECGASLYYLYQPGVSLITTARNGLVAKVLEYENVTDVLFVDSDILFPTLAPIEMMQWLNKYDVVGCAYRMKTDDGGIYSIHFNRDEEGKPLMLEGGELLSCTRLPGGFIAMKRSVLKRLWDTHSDQEFKHHGVVYRNIYDCRYDKEESCYIGEDYVFCDKVIAEGFSMVCMPKTILTHIGSKGYAGNLYDSIIAPELRGLKTNVIGAKDSFEVLA